METSRKEQLSLLDFKLNNAACLSVKSEPVVKRKGKPMYKNPAKHKAKKRCCFSTQNLQNRSNRSLARDDNHH